MPICEEGKFKQIYLDWCEDAQRFAQSKGINREEALDIVQDAFVRMWNNCDKILEEKVKSYLFTIVNNLTIDKFRKEHKRPQVALTSVVEKGSIVQSGQYELEAEEFRQKYEQAINNMNDGAREVFIMHRMNEMSYNEIAQTLNLSVKAIEKRMQKALIHLADQKIMKRR